MKTSNKLFISNEEAEYICDKNQYGEASFFEIIKLNIRFIHCKFTRAYIKRNKQLTKIIGDSDLQVLEASRKEELKRRLNEQLLK